MTFMATARLVAGREIRERTRSRAFKIGLVVQVLAVAAIVAAAALFSDDSKENYDVGVRGAEAALVVKEAGDRADAVDAKIAAKPQPSLAVASKAVNDGDLDAAVIDDRLVIPTDPESQLVALLQDASSMLRTRAELREAGVSRQQIAAALAPPRLVVSTVGDDNSGASDIAFLTTMFLYIAILMMGYAVSSGVVEEKTSRVVEVILAAIRPRPLLAGKVFGIGVVGLIQMLVVAAVGVGGASVSGSIDLPSTAGATVGLGLLWFVLGYAFYSTFFAIGGAIVSGQEDLQSSTAPVSFVLIGSYIASITVSEDASSGLATALTLLPPTAPMVVPARAADDALPIWELGASIVLMLAATALLVMLAARVYERAILRTGSAMNMRQALRLAKD